MTWSKYGSEFWDDCANAGLTDAAARTHAEAIGWIYHIERDDLCIPKNLVRRFAGSPQWEDGVAELLAAGFWEECAETYLVLHHGDVVRSSIAAQRTKRERDKRAQRALRKRNSAPEVSADVSADVSAGVSAGVSGDADRQTDSQEVRASNDEQNGWPVVARPEPRAAETCDSCGKASRFTLIAGQCRSCRAEDNRANYPRAS